MNKIELLNIQEQIDLFTYIQQTTKNNFCLFVDNNIFGGYDLADKYGIKNIVNCENIEEYWKLNVFIREEFCRLAINYLNIKK